MDRRNRKIVLMMKNRNQPMMQAGGGIWSALGRANDWLKKNAIISRGLGYLGTYLPGHYGSAASAASGVASSLGYGRRRKRRFLRRRMPVVLEGGKRRRKRKY